MSNADSTTPKTTSNPAISLTAQVVRPNADTSAASPAIPESAGDRLACLQTLCLTLASARTEQQVEDAVRRAGGDALPLSGGAAGSSALVMDANTRVFGQTLMQMRAQALERVGLAQSLAGEQRGRQEAQREWEQAALTQNVTARLSQAVTPQEVATVIVDAGAEILGAHRGVLALLTTGGDGLQVARALGYEARVAQAWQQFPLSAPIPLADSARDRRAIWIRNLGERDTRYPQLARIRTSSHAYAVVPLAAQGRVLGAVSFGFDHARDFDDADRAFITALAEQGAFALVRARLYAESGAALARAESLNARLRHSMAETNHRVKNNLQVISALVELQIDPAQTTVSADAMRRVGVHARALATLHDLLADQKTALEVNTVSARALIGKMIPLLQITTGEHKMLAHIDDIRLPVRVGASLCLLINELVSNAVKHGGRQVRLSLTGPAAPDSNNLTSEPAEPAELSGYYEDIRALLAITQAEAAGRAQSGVWEDEDGEEGENDGNNAVTSQAANASRTAGDRSSAAASTAFFDAGVSDASLPPRQARLVVSDDGPGFAPDFDVLRSANTGLDLVVNISRLDMNGSVTFANAPEGGAQVSITFTLPE